jgi:chemotaxis protein methyltransferase CheR
MRSGLGGSGVNRPAVRVAELDLEAAQEFLRILFRRAHLSYECYRSGALIRRVPACLRFLRTKDVKVAIRMLEGSSEVVAAMLNIVLLGVTEFVRDRTVFSQIRDLVLPELKAKPALRVWSAACSDGRELYSVGILLRDAGLLEKAELLGTDCRDEAIGLASKGIFSSEDLEAIEPWWKKYFTGNGTSICIDESIRQAATWKKADLLSQVEPGPWNLILWRNMAIYLDPSAVERIWLELVDQIEPGGYLVVGKADGPPSGIAIRKVVPCIYQKIAL